MGALIRSATLAPIRIRLIGAPSEAAPASASVAPEQLRAQLEREVRDELLVQAEAAFKAEREKAHAQGYAAGLAAAEVDAAKQQAQALGDMRARATEALSLLGQAHAAALMRMATDVGEVAFECVCRLLGHQALSPACVLGLVEEVVSGMRVDAIMRARLHPRDLDTLRSLLDVQGQEPLAARLKALSIDLVADESLALGGCVIETAAGEFDGGLDAQLRRLHETLLGDVDKGGKP